MHWKISIENRFVCVYFAVNLYREVGTLHAIHLTETVTVLSLKVYK